MDNQEKVNLNQAYGKYLEVFPCYWDPNGQLPVSLDDFDFFHRIATITTRRFEMELTKGKLSPATYYAKTVMDQYLGIPKTKKQMTHAFRYGFASGSHGETHSP